MNICVVQINSEKQYFQVITLAPNKKYLPMYIQPVLKITTLLIKRKTQIQIEKRNKF